MAIYIFLWILLLGFWLCVSGRQSYLQTQFTVNGFLLAPCSRRTNKQKDIATQPSVKPFILTIPWWWRQHRGASCPSGSHCRLSCIPRPAWLLTWPWWRCGGVWKDACGCMWGWWDSVGEFVWNGGVWWPLSYTQDMIREAVGTDNGRICGHQCHRALYCSNFIIISRYDTLSDPVNIWKSCIKKNDYV